MYITISVVSYNKKSRGAKTWPKCETKNIAKSICDIWTQQAPSKCHPDYKILLPLRVPAAHHNSTKFGQWNVYRLEKWMRVPPFTFVFL